MRNIHFGRFFVMLSPSAILRNLFDEIRYEKGSGMRLLLSIVLVLVFACGWADAAEKLGLSPLFSAHMVLQREIPVPVWGVGEPAAEVSVNFAGQAKTAKVDEKGEWKVVLEPLKAENTPAVMTIKSGERVINVDDVLVGEVWLCSGQSNMDYALGGLKMQYKKETPLAAEMATADFPLIRQFDVVKNVSFDNPLHNYNGKWVVCTPSSVSGYTAVGFFFARVLYQKLNIPVGIIKCAWGGMPVETFMSRDAFVGVDGGKGELEAVTQRLASFSEEAAAAKNKKDLEKWKIARKKNAADNKTAPKKPNVEKNPAGDPRNPTSLYNAMIYPLAPYAIRGAIWYQGEENGHRVRNDDKKGKPYAERFAAMITDWRKAWGQGDFPFYYVQLANMFAVTDVPAEFVPWAHLREAQLQTLSVSNTGMAVTIDVGEGADIHPRNKVVVGERLALLALAKDYKQDVSVFSGPLYKSAEFKDGKAVLTFDQVGTGLAAGKRADVWTAAELNSNAPERFQICGADKKWVWAAAKIIGKDTVEVSAGTVKEPVAVRYAWMNNPGSVVLLYNKEGLPASPFRTDSN